MSTLLSAPMAHAATPYFTGTSSCDALTDYEIIAYTVPHPLNTYTTGDVTAVNAVYTKTGAATIFTSVPQSTYPTSIAGGTVTMTVPGNHFRDDPRRSAHRHGAHQRGTHRHGARYERADLRFGHTVGSPDCRGHRRLLERVLDDGRRRGRTLVGCDRGGRGRAHGHPRHRVTGRGWGSRALSQASVDVAPGPVLGNDSPCRAAGAGADFAVKAGRGPGPGTWRSPCLGCGLSSWACGPG